jgi:hypothetical protein
VAGLPTLRKARMSRHEHRSDGQARQPLLTPGCNARYRRSNRPGRRHVGYRVACTDSADVRKPTSPTFAHHLHVWTVQRILGQSSREHGSGDSGRRIGAKSPTPRLRRRGFGRMTYPDWVRDRIVRGTLTEVSGDRSEKDMWSNGRYAPDGVLFHRYKNAAFAGIL